MNYCTHREKSFCLSLNIRESARERNNICKIHGKSVFISIASSSQSSLRFVTFYNLKMHLYTQQSFKNEIREFHSSQHIWSKKGVVKRKASEKHRICDISEPSSGLRVLCLMNAEGTESPERSM